jgi:hypothetical protein
MTDLILCGVHPSIHVPNVLLFFYPNFTIHNSSVWCVAQVNRSFLMLFDYTDNNDQVNKSVWCLSLLGCCGLSHDTIRFQRELIETINSSSPQINLFLSHNQIEYCLDELHLLSYLISKKGLHCSHIGKKVTKEQCDCIVKFTFSL